MFGTLNSRKCFNWHCRKDRENWLAGMKTLGITKTGMKIVDNLFLMNSVIVLMPFDWKLDNKHKI